MGFYPSTAAAQEHGDETDETGQEASHVEEEFDPATFILEHIADSHEWYIYTKKSGEHVSLPLPVILYTRDGGLTIFSSKKLAHEQIYEGFKMGEGESEGLIVMVDNNGHIIEDSMALDFSITKNVAAMMVAAILLLILFISLGNSYKKHGISAPKGIQGFLEPLVLFVRDDIAIPNIGEHRYERYMPYLLTVFFFILINNLMGLIPIIPGGA
ncbi:MAG: F0F1 ATP synthase subunit A, partial [Bacteroidia bacterium]